MAITTGTLILGAGYATITYAVVGGIALYGLSSVFGNALGMGRPKMPQMGGGSGLSNNIDPVANFEIIYGETRKGGTKTYMELTNDDKYLHTIITLAGHEVNSIGDIYLDDEVVSFSGSDGTVTTSKWNSKVYIKKFTGASNQSVYSTLNSLTYKPTQINSNFKGQGIACLYVRLEYDRDTFPNGMPLVTAKIQGKKVYDPRKDSTSSAYDNSLGVSSHRTNNPSTWQYSDEPALAIRDYLTSNLGLDADQSDIDDDMIATAIADCASTGVVGVQNNAFKIGGVLDTGATPSGNLNTLMTTLNGTLFWGQGKWRLLAGAYKSPDASVSNANAFGYDDFRSDISIATRLSRRDTTNTVRGTFIDGSSDGRFIATDYPQQQIPDLSEDNDEVSILDLELPLTTNSATAQRLAKQVLFVSREQITFSADFSLEKAFGVQIGDTVEVTLDRYGWARKTFRVMSWKMSGMDGSAPVVNMTLQETSATAYQWSISSDEYQQITQNNTNLGDPTSNLAITGLATTLASSLQTDGTSMSRVILSWNAVSSPILRHYEVEWKPSSLSNYSSTIAPNNAIEIEPLTAGTTYNFRVRAVTVRENSGSYATINATAVTDTTAPPQPQAPTVTAGVKQLEISWANYFDPLNPTDPERPADFAFMEVFEEISGSTYQRGTSAGTSFVHGGLTQNTTHTYKIRAVDYSGNTSAVSLTANGTVAADVQGPTGPAGQSGLVVTLNGADIPMNNQTGEPPTETGVDPRPNNSTTQGKLDEAFLAVNPLLAQMSDIPEDATVWARFVLTKEETFTTTAGQTFFTINGTHTKDAYTRVLYDGEQLISGDFLSTGQSNVVVNGGYASITLQSQFFNRFGLSSLPAGKTVEIYFIQASARKWDYSSQNWTDNADLFDAPVIFSPLVLSKEVLTESLAANEITADQLIINKDVDLLDGAAWRIGKSDYADVTDGIFFGNPSGTGATNYAFAFTATSNSGQSTQHGIEITPQQTKLIQPTITKQATGALSISDKQSTQTITIKSGSTNPNAQTVTINAIGGGGGGAGAESQSGTAGAGGDTTYTLTITGGAQAGTYNVTASGGAAGTGYGAAKTDGNAGEASARASGGYGGGAYGVGGTCSLGSCGGGGGGRDYNWNTSSRKGGDGGGAGSHVSNSYDISAATSVSLNITAIGAGGSGMSSSRGNGGAGGTGVLYGAIETEGLDPVFLNTQRIHSDVTSSRTWDTWYLNGSNEAVMQIFVYPNTFRIFQFYVNTSASTSGATLIGQTEPTAYTGGDLTVIVAAGQYYSLRRANVNSGDQIRFWGEYK